MFFISPKKLFSFWRYLSFCSDFFFHVGKWLDVKVKVNFKIYHIANWEIIETHTLSSVSRSKGNQTIKFGQLVEYNIRNIFFWKFMPKMWCRNYSQTLFWKMKIDNIYGSRYLWIKVSYSLFNFMSKYRTIEIYWN